MLHRSLPRTFLLFLMGLLTLLLQSCKKERYESPDYGVIRSEGNFELREYPESMLVTTPMKQHAGNGAFMRLFRFISGRNERSEKISMTTPVLMSSGEGTMGFIVPREVARRGVPRPSDPGISVITMPASPYASYRFSGYGNPSTWGKAVDLLEGWMKQEGLKASGTPLYAGYNPPWTPGFLRRNEILIPVRTAKP
jgi:hypothetical protein